MSFDAASAPVFSRPVTQVRTRSREQLWLIAAVVALTGAFVARVALAWLRATPEYFPDEYIYTALGRSLASLHGTSVRGAPAHFPALLQPIVTAPAWRIGSVETGFRIVQAIGTAFFTLAALPVYLLARRLSLPRSWAYFAAAIAVLVPDGVYAGFVLTDPIAYPLALAATCAGVAALAQPRLRTQAAFLLLAGLATFARIQFVVIPLCYLAAALVLALRERAIRRALREQRGVLAAFGVLLAAALVHGPARVIGYYHNALHLHPHPLAVLTSTGQNLLVLAYAGGWIIIPGALLGLALAVVRPRTRAEGAFGTFALLLILALLAEATIFGGTREVHERYAFAIVPLAAISFALHVSRGWPYRRVHLLLLGTMLLLSTMPLSGYAQNGSDDHSPLLYGIQWLEWQLGNGNAAVALAGAAAALILTAALATFSPRRGPAVVAAAAVLACGAGSAAAYAFDTPHTRSIAHETLPADPSWVDHAHVGRVTLVTGYHGESGAAEEQMFWNRSIDRVAVLPNGAPPDPLAVDAAEIDRNGQLRVHGRPLSGAVLLEEFAETFVTRGGHIVDTSPGYTLWAPAGAPRLALVMSGRHPDGSIEPRGAVTLWPAHAGGGLAGRLELRFAGLKRIGPLNLTIKNGARRWDVHAVPGHTVRLSIPVCSTGPWTATLRAGKQVQNVLLQPVSGRAALPRFVPDASACG